MNSHQGMNLFKRVVSASFAVAFIFIAYGLFFHWGLLVLGIVALGLAFREWQRVVYSVSGVHSGLMTALFGFFCLILGSFVCNFPSAFQELHLIIIGILSALLLAFGAWWLTRFCEARLALILLSLQLLVALYIGLFGGLGLRLLVETENSVLFLIFLLMVFSGDVSAYFIGRAFGGPKLLSRLSPGKTWSGAIGGGIFTTGVAVGAGFFEIWSLSLFQAVSVGVAVSFFAQVGDLFESLCKRAADFKDSGSLMPGHGGILDRIDGVIFAAPIYSLFVLT